MRSAASSLPRAHKKGAHSAQTRTRRAAPFGALPALSITLSTNLTKSLCIKSAIDHELGKRFTDIPGNVPTALRNRAQVEALRLQFVIHAVPAGVCRQNHNGIPGV